MRFFLNLSVVVKCGLAIALLSAPFMAGSKAIAQPLAASAAYLLSKPTPQSSALSETTAPKNIQRIQLLTAAIEQNPDNANLYNSRGWYYFQQGAYAESIADYTRVEELGIEMIDGFYQPTVYYVRGLAYAQLGESKSAIADLEIALEMYQASGNEAAVQEIQTTIEKLKTLPERESAS